MQANVRAFKTKLVLFSDKSFALFPTLATLKETLQHVEKYRKSLDDLQEEFCRWFCDFGKIYRALQLVLSLFSQDPETVPQELQMEPIDLQGDKFNSLKLDEFHASLSAAKHPEDGTEDASAVYLYMCV